MPGTLPVRSPMREPARGPAATRPRVPLPTWAFIALMTSLTAISALSNSLFIPSMPAMTRDLSTDAATVQLTLAVYSIGFAVAQLAWGPLIDRFGRRGSLIVGLVVYFAASLACWLAPNVEVLVAFRLVQAFGVCCAPVAARAVVRDLYELREAARMLSYVSSAFALTPVLAPALGAVIEENLGWRANFLFMVAAGGVILAAALAWLPETAPKRRMPVRPSLIVASYASLIGHRTFLGYSLLVTFAFVPFFVFNSVAPFYLIEETGLTPTEFALPYATIAMWFGVSAFVAARITHRLGIERTILGGALVCVAGATLEAGLIFAGVANVFALCGAMSLYSFGAGFVFPNSQAGAVAPFPDRAGAAAALNGFLQMTLAALLGVLVMQIYDGSPIPMAIFIVVFAAAALPPYVLLILRRRRPSPAYRSDG